PLADKILGVQPQVGGNPVAIEEATNAVRRQPHVLLDEVLLGPAFGWRFSPRLARPGGGRPYCASGVLHISPSGLLAAGEQQALGLTLQRCLDPRNGVCGSLIRL